MSNEIILDVKDLKTYFNTDNGIVKAVDGVSFKLKKGETLGLVGESGSGKSVTNLSLMQLIPSPPGKIMGGEAILNDGTDILKLSENEMSKLRGNKMSMIFQDPMTSLNPFLRISTQMIETIVLHQNMNKDAAMERAIEMLELVGIPGARQRVNNYPHQFSGGMLQRVMIAMALSCDPEILIADEPTSALDVTIQAQILELIQSLAEKLNTSIIMITHDLGVVAGICENVIVMYAGRIVEKGTNHEIFEDPKHPYTQGLIKSLPRIDKPAQDRLYSIDGQPPNVIDLPECCPFHPRCEQATEVCKIKTPPVTKLENDRQVRCFLFGGEK